MPYTETYREVAIVISENEVTQKHPDGSLDYREIRLRPELNGYTASYLLKCEGGSNVPATFDAQQTNDKVSELREKALSKLHSYIDRVLDSSQSAPWLQSQQI